MYLEKLLSEFSRTPGFLFSLHKIHLCQMLYVGCDIYDRFKAVLGIRYQSFEICVLIILHRLPADANPNIRV